MLWTCPQCGSKKQGPERPRMDATVRYCLTCSAKGERLVARVCKALEDRRAKREAARRAATERKRETRKRAKDRQASRKLEADEQRYQWAGYDLRGLWSNMLALPTASQELDERVPMFQVRRCSRRPSSRVGVAWYRRMVAQVSLWDGLELDFLVDTMVHELAHLVSYLRYGREDGPGHGHGFKRTYTLLHQEWKQHHPTIPIQNSHWLLETP